MFRMFGGKHPEFTIQLDRADAVYFPGDTVRAVVTLTSAGESKFREISVGLLYQERFQVVEIGRETDGDHTSPAHEWRTDEQWAGKEIIARNGALTANFNQTYNFAWQIPQRVGASYNGEIAQVSWLVKATIDRQTAQQITHETPLGVVVPPPNTYIQAGEFIEDNPAHETVDVRFQLPKLEFVRGEEVRGRIALLPKALIEPRFIRLDLVRTERVPADGGNNKSFVEGSLTLASKSKLQARVTVDYDFSFQIPLTWCPSYRTLNSYATWHLALTLVLPQRDDTTASQSLLIFNGYQIPQPAQSAQDATITDFSPVAHAPIEQPISQPLTAPPTHEALTLEPLAASSPPPKPPSPPDAQNQSVIVQTPAPQAAAKTLNPARRYCTNCGAPMPYNANFCPACGTAVFRP